MAKKIERKVLFFTVRQKDKNLGEEERRFEKTCQAIMMLPVIERKLLMPNSGPDEYLRLISFEKSSENADYYQGRFVKYRSSNLTVGSDDNDKIEDHELEDGLKPTDVTRFLFYPKTRILCIEYIHHGAKHRQLLRYINGLQGKCGLEPIIYIPDVLCHPDVLQELKHAEYVKSLELGLPRYEIPSGKESSDIFRSLRAAANIGRPGRVAIKVIGPSKRGDKSPLMTGYELVDTLTKENLDLGIFGTAKVEAMMEYGMETINLLQNSLDSTIQILPGGSIEHDLEVYEQIRKIYTVNKDVLILASGQSNE